MTAEDWAELRSLVDALPEEEQQALLASLRQDPPARRRPGAVRGQIRIADDFDTLPPGLAGAFSAPQP